MIEQKITDQNLHHTEPSGPGCGATPWFWQITPGCGAPHKGLNLPKRFTNLPLGSSGCLGEKRRSCIKRKKKLGIQLKFCIFYISSHFYPKTHNLSQHQNKQATLCSDCRGGLWTFLAISALCATGNGGKASLTALSSKLFSLPVNLARPRR